jgi:hypothetical protein
MTTLIPPARREPLVEKSGVPTRRAITFLEDVATQINGLPSQMSNIADVSGTSAANNEAKINEILAELINSGLMAAP